VSYQAQHRAAPAAPQDHQPYRAYQPYVIPGAVPPVRSRKWRMRSWRVFVAVQVLFLALFATGTRDPGSAVGSLLVLAVPWGAVNVALLGGDRIRRLVRRVFRSGTMH
jgi:hypothetical protein